MPLGRDWRNSRVWLHRQLFFSWDLEVWFLSVFPVLFCRVQRPIRAPTCHVSAVTCPSKGTTHQWALRPWSPENLLPSDPTQTPSSSPCQPACSGTPPGRSGSLCQRAPVQVIHGCAAWHACRKGFKLSVACVKLNPLCCTGFVLNKACIK